MQITWVVHFLYYPFFNMYILFYIFTKFLSPKKILVQKFPNILQKNVHFFTTLFTELFGKKPRFFRKKLAHFFPILTNCTKKIMAEKKQKFLKKVYFLFLSFFAPHCNNLFHVVFSYKLLTKWKYIFIHFI